MTTVSTPTPTPLFAGSLFINLDRRPDRLVQFMDGYRSTDLVHIPLRRIPAIDVRGLPLEVLLSMLTPTAQEELEDLLVTGTRRHHAQLTVGAIGCCLSHMEAWKHIVAYGAGDPDRPWLLFEDDVVFSHPSVHAGFAKYYADALDAFQRRYGPQTADDNQMVLLVNFASMCVLGCAAQVDPKYPKIGKPYVAFGTHAYSLTPRMAQRLLALNVPPLVPMDVQIDSALCMHPAVIFASPIPFKARPVPSMSTRDLGTDIQTSMIGPGYMFR